jgi:hypothetical protein
MEVNEVFNPPQVGMFGLNTVMLAKNDLAYLFEERARLGGGNVITHKFLNTVFINSSCCVYRKQAR